MSTQVVVSVLLVQLSAAFLGCDLQRHVGIPVRSNGGNVDDPVLISGGPKVILRE